jgi:hypothetical protein
MTKALSSLVVAGMVALFAGRAEASLIAVYGSAHGGVQKATETNLGGGVEVGARLLLLDAYLDYTAFSKSESVSRGIFGVRGGVSVSDFRLVLRAGVGGIHEESGALSGHSGAPGRTGGVARAGAGFEWILNRFVYLGVGVDVEAFRFANNSLGIPVQGSDVFAALRLTFELGI